MNFSDLSPKQQRIVETDEGVVIINAGPGTGKTKTLTSRIVYLILGKTINSQNILALTFTQRAACEMKERLGPLLGNNLPNVTTFHGFAYNFLNSCGHNIEIISEEERDTLLKKVVKKSAVKKSTRELSLIISRFKNTTTKTDIDENTKKLITAYNEQLASKKLWDFDDLLVQMYKIVKEKSDKKKELQNHYQYILIDEFQDTNDLQYQIIKLILRDNPNLLVIGDPLQSIYGFRGANSRVFDLVKNDFSKVYQETLEVNYRSDLHLVEITSLLFDNIIQLKSASKSNGKVALINTLNEYSEADWVINFINQKIGGVDLQKARDEGLDDTVSFKDFAIIYRTHGLSSILEQRLNESGFPFQIIKEDTSVFGDHIKLLSMHAAKGLEFKYVFICGFEEGLIPHKNCGEEKTEIEEEKRLLYVAMTRAKKELYLLCAKKRRQKLAVVSRFKKLLEHPNFRELEDEATEKIIQRIKALKLKKSQMSLF